MHVYHRCREYRNSEAGLLDYEAPARYSDFPEGSIARISASFLYDTCIEEKFEVYGEFSRCVVRPEQMALQTSILLTTVHAFLYVQGRPPAGT